MYKPNHYTRITKNVAVNLRALLVVTLFVISQAASISHLIQHDADENNDHCEICQVAAHLGNAAIPDTIQLSAPAHAAAFVAETSLPHFYTSVTASYASRAPPKLV